MSRHAYSKNRTAYKKRGNNLISMVIIVIIVFLVITAVSVNSMELKKKKAQYDKKADYLQEQIFEQEKRQKSIEDYGKYMQTKQYVEDQAKEKLGLVYPNEIVLEAQN